MKHSPLQLVRYLVTDIACTSNPKFIPEKEMFSAMEQFTVEAKASPLEPTKDIPGHPWSVEMIVTQKIQEGQNFPYEFRISMVGIFGCNNTVIKDEKEARFVRVNGSSMLYGIAREQIRTLTAASPWGAILIPTISFYDNVEHTSTEAAPAKTETSH